MIHLTKGRSSIVDYDLFCVFLPINGAIDYTDILLQSDFSRFKIRKKIGGTIVNYNPKEFGMRIRKLRMKFGKNQQQMADSLHISLDYYRALENGRRSASLDLLVILSLTFEVPLDYLILGQMKSSDSQWIQWELGKIMDHLGRLKESI